MTLDCMRSLDDILQGVEFLALVVGKCPMDKFNLQSSVSHTTQSFSAKVTTT